MDGNNFVRLAILISALAVLGIVTYDTVARHSPSMFGLVGVEMTTPIDTAITTPSHVPSYVDARNYHIVFNGKLYIAQLPGGTPIGSYKTAEDAQAEINRFAKDSRKRWESGEGF